MVLRMIRLANSGIKLSRYLSALKPSIFALSIERSFAMLVKPKRLDNASSCYGCAADQI